MYVSAHIHKQLDVHQVTNLAEKAKNAVQSIKHLDESTILLNEPYFWIDIQKIMLQDSLEVFGY